MPQFLFDTQAAQALPPQAMKQILVRQGDGPPKAYPLKARLTLGRDQTCGIQLASRQVSRVHAVLEPTTDGLVVTDQGSMNGSLLDGRPLQRSIPTTMAPGQVLTLGEFTVILAPDGRTVPKAPASPPLDAPHHAAHTPTPIQWDIPKGLPVWSGAETELIVNGVIQESAHAKTFRLIGRQPLQFAYLPGQSMRVKCALDGRLIDEVVAISSTPSRGQVLEFTVCTGSPISATQWLHDRLQVGDPIEVAGPLGRFSCVLHPCPKLLLAAEGDGIGNALSMVRWLTDSGIPADVVLLYAIESPDRMVFGEELEWLAARHANIRVLPTVTGDAPPGQAWMGWRGRLNGATIAMAVSDVAERQAFVSGPETFQDQVAGDLGRLGLPEVHIHRDQPTASPPDDADGALEDSPVPPPLPDEDPAER